LVGIVLVGSGVLLLKRANPNLAQDLLVSGEAVVSAPAEDSKPEARQAPGRGEATALEDHIRDVEEMLADGGSPGKAGVSQHPGRKINLNTATEAELVLLPGIGPARAQAMIRYRMEGGTFKNLEDVQKVEGIGPGIAARINPWICYE
jgi:comEA protein